MSSGKIIIGAVLVIIGLYLLIPIPGLSYPNGISWFDFLTVLKGVIPPLLVFVGAILIWVESEELKIEKPKKRK